MLLELKDALNLVSFVHFAIQSGNLQVVEYKKMSVYLYGNLCRYTHTYTHYWFILYLV